MGRQSFDPYHAWLAISPDQRPIDFYTLLGLPRYAVDAAAIGEAAATRTAHLTSLAADHQGQERTKTLRRLLREVANAKDTLLDPQLKQAYDAKLRALPSPQRRRTEEQPLAGPGGAGSSERPVAASNASSPEQPLPSPSRSGAATQAETPLTLAQSVVSALASQQG